MNDKIEKEQSDVISLWEVAENWVADNSDSIEVCDCYIPFDDIPEGEDESWVETEGSESDFSVGFKIIPVSNESGDSGLALITVRGHSWEGLYINLCGIYDTEKEAINSITEDGVIC